MRCALVLMIGAFPALAGTLSIQPPSLSVVVGQTFSLNVNVASISDLYAFEFDVTFNPSLLAALGVTEGSFLPSGGSTIFTPGTIDNVGGSIAFNSDSLIGPIPGVTGGGTLAVLQFMALGAGSSPINLANVTVLDSTLSTISANTTNGSITVQSLPEPASIVLCWVGLLAVAGGTWYTSRKP